MQFRNPALAAHVRCNLVDVDRSHGPAIPLTYGPGHAVFFNPVPFHAAGANTSENIHRFANLLRVQSEFARAMETGDRSAMSKLLPRQAV